jgi:AcrR family transcriptional regulator
MTDLTERTLRPETFLRRAPRQARSAERLENLLDATADILRAEGYPGVTVAALKTRTGMPHSTIYDVVADPRDLVAVLIVRSLDEMHDVLKGYAATIADAYAAVDFVRAVSLGFIHMYRTNDVLRAGLSGLESDPAYRWINLADSARNAHVVAGVMCRLTGLPSDVVYERCLLMSHLVGAAAAMAVDLGDEAGDSVVRAFEYLVEVSVPH